MPSTSWAQHKFMLAIAHSPSFATEVGVPQKVGKDFDKADKKAGITGNKKSLPSRAKKKGKRR